MWQQGAPGRGSVVVNTRARSAGESDADADDAAAAAIEGHCAAANVWLARLFETLLLDLDGCELTFERLRIIGEERGAPLLELTLDVCVRRFPSLEINF